MRFTVSCLLSCCLLVSATAGAATRLTSSGGSADDPDYRLGPGGNLYLVRHDAGIDSGAILFKAFNPSGNVLIPDIQVNDGASGSANTRPVMVLDSSRRAFVVWENQADQEVYLLRLEPLLDDLDPATPADLATIKTLGDTRISSLADGFPARNPALAKDASDNLHIVWESGAGGPVQYAKVDPNGVLLNGPVSLGGNGSGHDLPDIALDSAGHVHVVYTHAGTTTADEVYYAMLDGGSGALRIAPTRLTADDGLRAGDATINVDTVDNRVYVVYKEASSLTGNGAERIYLTALNPASDDQDGSAANPAAIRLRTIALTGPAARYNWHAFSRIGSDRRIHVIYMEFDDASCPGAANYTIRNMHVTYEGRILAEDTLTTTGTTLGCSPRARLAPRGDRVVWADSRTGSPEIFSQTFSRADAGSSGFTCSLGRPHAGPREAGELWLLLGFIAVLWGVRARRRNP